MFGFAAMVVEEERLGDKIDELDSLSRITGNTSCVLTEDGFELSCLTIGNGLTIRSGFEFADGLF